MSISSSHHTTELQYPLFSKRGGRPGGLLNCVAWEEGDPGALLNCVAWEGGNATDIAVGHMTM